MHLKIWHKMIIGISIPSLIAVLGSVFTYQNISDAQNRQGYVQLADDLQDNVLELRRNEKNFLHYKNSQYLKYATDALSHLNASVKNISPKTIEEIGRDDFLLLNKLTLKYPDFLSSLYDNYTLENSIIENVRAEGRKLEILTENKPGSKELSISFILHLRLLEKTTCSSSTKIHTLN